MDRDVIRSKTAKVIERDAPVSFREKELMLMILLRDKVAFEQVKDRLTEDCFGEYETGLQVLWIALNLFYDGHGEIMPSREPLFALVQTELDELPDPVSEEDAESLTDTIYTAYELDDPSPTDRKYALGVAERLLQQQVAIKTRKLLEEDDDTPTDLPKLLQALADQSAAAANIQPSSINIPFPEGWEESLQDGIRKKPTRLPFMDYFLGGGHAPGETYLILGPYGTCKTLLAVQGSIEAAIQEQALQKESDDGKTGVCYLFAYEAILSELRLRALACAAQISYPGLINHGIRGLSDSNNLKEYEIKKFQRQIQAGLPVPGEIERMQACQEVLNRNWRPISLSAGEQDENGLFDVNRGAGLVPEISARIQNDLDQNPGTFCAGVWVDYLGTMVERHITAHNKNRDETRHLLKSAPLYLAQMVGQRFDCPVWAFHQYSGSANERKPGADMSQTDAAECKSIAEHVAFSFALGTKTDDQLVVLSVEKTRRDVHRPKTVLKVHGEFQTVIDTRGQYTVDPTSKMIVPAKDYNRVSGGAKSTKKSNDDTRDQIAAVGF